MDSFQLSGPLVVLSGGAGGEEARHSQWGVLVGLLES